LRFSGFVISSRVAPLAGDVFICVPAFDVPSTRFDKGQMRSQRLPCAAAGSRTVGIVNAAVLVQRRAVRRGALFEH